MKQMKSGGGWKAIHYTLRLANRVGWLKLWNAMRSRNTCKTCALGMGGQLGGMVNEGGYFPEVCKKSFQAMVSDMQKGITPEFFEKYGFNELKALSSRELEECGRLVTPLYAGPDDTGYRAISWDEALQRVADKLQAAGPERSFFYASGRSSNEAGFLLQLFARLFGTNYVNNCSYYCHQASGVGMGSSIGSGTGTIRLEDLDKTDLYILIGANPASNHPRLMRSLMQIRRRGGNVIVINPTKELGLVNFRVPSDVRSLLFGTEIASLYIQPHIGGDIALLTGVAKEILARNAHNESFINEVTEGFADFASEVEAADWGTIEKSSGVPRKQIVQIAEMYSNAKHAVFAWAMGITHHQNGCNNVRMIANLALLRGMVGQPHAGLMPIRGHSNIQGMGSVGVTPTLKKAMLDRYEQQLGISAPTSPGLDTMACMEAADRNEMDTAICLGGNLYGSNPDANFAHQALAKIGCNVYMTTTLNTGHAWGRGKETLILPVLPRDEEPQSTTQESMFSYVRLSDGGPPRYDGPRSEVSILSKLGELVLGNEGPVDWENLASHEAIRELIAELIPGFEQMAGIGKTHKEFHIPGRQFDNKRFSTPSGKAKFHAVKIDVEESLAENDFLMMTIRSEGQFNTVVYEEQDIYRGQDRRDIVLINPNDLERLKLQPDQTVRVQSSVGEMRYQRVRPFDVRAGNALMYCPEANILVPRDVDPESKTPGFKKTKIKILAEV